MRRRTLSYVYGRALIYVGLALLGGVLVLGRFWRDAPLLTLSLGLATLVLRGFHVPLSKYSFLTQTSLVALAGGMLAGPAATAVGLAAGVWLCDWGWHRKPMVAAVVNVGREVIAFLAAYGLYAGVLALTHLRQTTISFEMLPAAAALVIGYFLISRTLFYFSLLIREKLEVSERLLIVRYEAISYALTVVAAVTVVVTVVALPTVAWLFVGAFLLFTGMAVRRIVHEAITAEERNKIQALHAVISSGVDLQTAFDRIEVLAHRLLDWGDYRIYRLAGHGPELVYRGGIGRPDRGDPLSGISAARARALAGEVVSIEDCAAEPSLAPAPGYLRSLVLAPLRFGDTVLGTLELEHHKPRQYRPRHLQMIGAFATQLATAIHIADLRRPLVETVERIARHIQTLARAAASLRGVTASVAASTEAIGRSVAQQDQVVASGLEATAELSEVAERVRADAAAAATASGMASGVAGAQRDKVGQALDRLVRLKAVVGEAAAQVGGLERVSERITGFIASIGGFSEATQLIGLNAAIEAAHAGARGKAFAVVADEVRQLAEQSRTAAREASRLTGAIHEELGRVIEQMQRGQAAAAGVEELSAAALGALEAIETATTDATERARRIADSTAEQDQRYAELRGRIQAIAELSGKNRADVQDVSGQARAAAVGLAELEAATHELEQVAVALGDITRRFTTLETPA
jgi:methyl-accepting chemotaxis protein/putative methionine-R-sulfoxide reductase with GAF domain